MRLLLENWKRYLNEGADPRIQKQIDALKSLSEDIGILIEKGSTMGAANIMTFQYVQILGRNPLEFYRLQDSDTGIPHGKVDIWKTDEGACFGGWAVLQSEAERGWGPLLYEVALEWASGSGGGLTSDRGIVSDDAIAVWDKYTKRGDVEAKQMDVDHKEKWMQQYAELTPDIKVDDCDQGKAIDLKDDKWMVTSVSKMFYKDTTPVLDTLALAGRILEA
tara:strand:- start:171 stop:830 length:660 start_codon:yes stop_codon:yes gene_type:complete